MPKCNYWTQYTVLCSSCPVLLCSLTCVPPLPLPPCSPLPPPDIRTQNLPLNPPQRRIQFSPARNPLLSRAWLGVPVRAREGGSRGSAGGRQPTWLAVLATESDRGQGWHWWVNTATPALTLLASGWEDREGTGVVGR